MKKIYSTLFYFLLPFLFYCSVTLASNSAMFITGQNKDINVVVSNMCEYYSLMLICKGDSNVGTSPVLASGNCIFDLHYTFYDSLSVLNKPKFIKMSSTMGSPYSNQKLLAGDESTVISFDATYGTYNCDSIYIAPADTLLTDSLLAGEITGYNNIVFIRNSSVTNNFFAYDFDLNFIYSLHLNMTPLFISSPQSSGKAAVIGINQNNETILNIIDLANQQIIKDTLLGSVAAIPTSVNVNGNNVYVTSQPGDSVINIIKYSYLSGAFTVFQVYSGSGLNTGAWIDYTYHFQPASDVTGNNLDRNVFVFNIFFMTTDTFNINRKLLLISSPGNAPGGSYPYVAVVDSAFSDMAIFYSASDYWLADSFVTSSTPEYFAADFRCPVKVSEYDDSMIEWKVYPNPSMDDFKLSASGLICGRDYKIDIIDMEGKILYETIAHAKMTITLPTSHFDSGIYFVRIHTLKGFITQEIIKQ